MFLWPSFLLLCSLPLLHEVPVQFKRLGNVFGLRQFVATCHERMQPYTTQRVIHPVSGAYINFELRHALGKISTSGWVAMNHTIDAHQHARSSA